MKPPPGWMALPAHDPEPERVLGAFEAAARALPRRTFQVPSGFDFYDARNRDEIIQLNRWMLDLFRAVTPPAAFLHVADPELHHPGWRFFPHTPVAPDVSAERWWGFVPYLEGSVWHVPLLPDGDSYDFISPRLDFAFESRWDFNQAHRIHFVGAPLVAALNGPRPALLDHFIEVAA